MKATGRFAWVCVLGLCVAVVLLVWGDLGSVPSSEPRAQKGAPARVPTSDRRTPDGRDPIIDPTVEDAGPVVLVCAIHDEARRPIGGATVALVGPPGRESAEKTTDDSGEVAFHVADALGVVGAVASAPGFVPVERSIGDVTRLEFSLRCAGSLLVRVVDGQTGAGLREAFVLVRDVQANTRSERRTDAEGAASFEALAIGRMRIAVEAAGFAVLTRNVTVGAGEEVVTLELERGGSVHGAVTRDGIPVGGARVWRGSSDGLPLRPVETDALGRYELVGFTGDDESVVAEDSAGLRVGQRVTIPAGHDRVQIDLDLGPAFLLEGKVTGNGEALVGASVSVASAPLVWGEKPDEVRTGEDGSFALPTRVFTGRPALLAVAAEGWRTAHPTVPTDPGARLLVELEPAARVVGQVVSSGQPVRQGFISLWGRDDAGTPVKGGTELRADGSFDLALAGGSFMGQVNSPTARHRDLAGLALESGQTLDLGVIELEPGELLAGTVRGMDGEPIPGATVTAESPADVLNASWVSTAPDGFFRLEGLPAGLLSMRIDAPGFKRSVHEGVAAGTAQVEVVLEREDAVIVHVVGADASVPGPFTYELFAITPAQGLMPERHVSVSRGRGYGGKVSFPGLARGTYSLAASRGDDVGVADLAVGDLPVLIVRVPLVGGKPVSGQVEFSDGRAAPRAVVRLQRLSPPAKGQRLETRTDAAGAFDLGAVSAGEWSLTVEAEGVPVRRRNITIDDMHRAPLRERLAVGGAVEIRVVAATVESVRACRMELRDDAGNRTEICWVSGPNAPVKPPGARSSFFQPDERGFARAELVDPGDHVLHVRAADGREVTREVRVDEGNTTHVEVDLR